LRFWYGHTPFWRWWAARFGPLTHPAQVLRPQMLAYVDERLRAGLAASSINHELRALSAFLAHLQTEGWDIPKALLRPPTLKVPDRLPRFLTDEQVRAVQTAVEASVEKACFPADLRLAHLQRAGFYLLWHGGLRVGEAEELLLDDLDLPARKLMVRQGKGQRDRAVYVTETAVRALREYLAMRGPCATAHVLVFRHAPLKKDLLRSRIKALGAQVGVAVTPHQLRHTFATQLLNAGCRITSIQHLLGHRDLSSTLVYARVHDHTLALDYFEAMRRVEGIR
jgi:site-specific recombinase XerD